MKCRSAGTFLVSKSAISLSRVTFMGMSYWTSYQAHFMIKAGFEKKVSMMTNIAKTALNRIANPIQNVVAAKISAMIMILLRISLSLLGITIPSVVRELQSELRVALMTKLSTWSKVVAV